MRRNRNAQAVARWQDYKFGMFIHWGLYAILARGEWVMFNEQIDVDEYGKLADEFSAPLFDPTITEEPEWILLRVPPEDRQAIDTILKLELDTEVGNAYNTMQARAE